MGMLAQAHLGVSDAELIALTAMNARGAVDLDCFGVEEPPFWQDTYQQLRTRTIANDNEMLQHRLCKL